MIKHSHRWAVVKVDEADKAVLVALVVSGAEAKLVAADKAVDRVDLEDQAAHKAVRVVLAVNEAVAKLVAADKVAVRAGLTLRMTQRSKKS